MQCVVIMCFYVLSHAPFLKGPCFWAADVMFYAICFYVLGHLIRKKKTVMEHKFALSRHMCGFDADGWKNELCDGDEE